MTSSLRSLKSIVWLDLRLMSRRPQLVVWTLLLPPLFAFVIGSATEAQRDAPVEEVAAARVSWNSERDLERLRNAGRSVTPEALQILESERRMMAATSVGSRPGRFTQPVLGLLVMFTMLVTLTMGAPQLVTDRRQRLLLRLGATPIRRSVIVTAKWSMLFVVGLAQVALAVAVGAVLFDVETGWLEASPTLLGWVAVNASGALLLAQLVRSEAQASTIGLGVTMVAAAIGGCWWPLELAPGWLQSAAVVFPSRWAMESLQLATTGAGFAATAPRVLSLSLLALGLGIEAERRFRWHTEGE